MEASHHVPPPNLPSDDPSAIQPAPAGKWAPAFHTAPDGHPTS